MVRNILLNGILNLFDMCIYIYINVFFLKNKNNDFFCFVRILICDWKVLLLIKGINGV